MVLAPYKYHILKVAALREVQEGVVVTFSDGTSALLRQSDWADGMVLRYLRLAQEGPVLVGVCVNDEGRIYDVAGVDRDTVLGIEDKGSMPTAVAVWFGRMDGLVALLKEHPKFQEITTALTQATASNQAVWYITRSGCILDVIQLSSEEDAALCQSLCR